MERYLKNILGCNVQKEEYELPLKMPQYLLNDYLYQKYTIENRECLFVAPLVFSFPAYKKQYQKIMEITNLQAVLFLKTITQYQRKILIEEHIPFVVEKSQIYLPFLAISLTEKFQKSVDVEKFTPITQLVFLYMFYNKTRISVTDLAQKINCTAMSVSRSYNSLVDCGLFNMENDGVKKYIVQNLNDGDLLRNAERFFISPIEKTIHIQNNIDESEYISSGIYALGKKTMLGFTKRDLCYAVYRKEKFNFENTVPKTLYTAENVITIEKWSYDPSILAQNGVVDDISLLITLKNNTDERIQIELEHLRSKYQW